MEIYLALLAVLAAYLMGSISAGYLVGCLVKGIDIREVGGHYTGAMNVFREVGPVAGAITLAGDFSKGAIAILLASLLGVPEAIIVLAGVAAVAGHIWPVFLQFRGGAGFATALGVLAAALPRQALILLLPMAILAWRLRGGMGLGLVSAFLLPILLALSWWLGESLPRILLPIFVGIPVAGRVYRDKLGWIGRTIFGAPSSPGGEEPKT